MDIYGWKGCSSKSSVTERLNKKADKKSIFDMKITRRIMVWRIMSMQRFTSVNRLCSIGRSLESLSTYKILNIYTTHLRHISSVDLLFQSFDIFSSPSNHFFIGDLREWSGQCSPAQGSWGKTIPGNPSMPWPDLPCHVGTETDISCNRPASEAWRVSQRTARIPWLVALWNTFGERSASCWHAATISNIDRAI